MSGEEIEEVETVSLLRGALGVMIVATLGLVAGFLVELVVGAWRPAFIFYMWMTASASITLGIATLYVSRGGLGLLVPMVMLVFHVVLVVVSIVAYLFLHKALAPELEATGLYEGVVFGGFALSVVAVALYLGEVLPLLVKKNGR